MAKTNQKPTDKGQAAGQAITSTEEFLKNNGKTLTWILIAVVAVVAVFIAVSNWVIKPAKASAQAETFPAEEYFMAADYESALNGDGASLGFADLISQYGAKAGKAVYFYAGVCELQLKNYESAITYLKKYKGKDDILAARALACLGDAYGGTNDLATAISYYDKAIAKSDNVLAATYMLKAGITAEEMGNNAKALEYYQAISDKYPQSLEAMNIDKYIYRIK